MPVRLHALCVDALDPSAQASFWAGLLGWTHSADDPTSLVPTDDTGFALRFLATEVAKVDRNRAHLDLTSSSVEDQQRTVARALDLGARLLDVGQGPDADHVVLADPEGNELCVIEPWNRFLADCGFIGALAGDGSRAVGHFWSRALGWPLVWDQDEETAIRSPYGGPKLTWGGPPLMPKTSRSRVRFEVAVSSDEDLDQLVGLGATDLGAGVMSDPDGEQFLVIQS